MIWLISLGITAAIITLELKFGVLSKPVIAGLNLFLFSHCIFLFNLAGTLPGIPALPLRLAVSVLAFFSIFRFAFHMPKAEVELSRRLRIMMGGRTLFLVSATVLLIQMPAVIAAGVTAAGGMPTGLFIADTVISFIIILLFLINGAVRIFFTSRRLGITYRALFLIFSWIPVINIIIGVYLCGLVKKEYLFELEKEVLHNVRAESRVCETKYPLLMLHGIGFRDYQLINYWGRIPELLKKNGATVEYGNQQAWGTIENNAEEIRIQTLEYLKRTGAEKINIIAHSKGGLDARYMISSLGMADKVASLTTISTPHRGSELVDVLSGLDDSHYRKISRTIDRTFKRLGDMNPDAYTSSKQLQPSYLEVFNRNNPDMPGVYYQSYATEMKNPASHSLLSLPQLIMKWKAGENDGLVTVDSAKWGEFRGTFTSSRNRGISHADQIDLMRQDYEGFNMAEEYVTIVSELKKKGL